MNSSKLFSVEVKHNIPCHLFLEFLIESTKRVLKLDCLLKHIRCTAEREAVETIFICINIFMAFLSRRYTDGCSDLIRKNVVASKRILVNILRLLIDKRHEIYISLNPSSFFKSKFYGGNLPLINFILLRRHLILHQLT